MRDDGIGSGLPRSPVATSARRLAWPVAGAAVALTVVAILVTWSFGNPEERDPFIAAVGLLGAALYAVLGALIASRTDNRIGWLFIAIVGIVGAGLVASAYADLGADRSIPLTRIAASLADPLFLTGLTLFVAVFFLFPTGQYASPRWRWAWRAYLFAVGVTFVGFAIDPAPIRLQGSRQLVPNPIGIEALGGVIGPILTIAGATTLLSAVAAFASLLVRYRRGSGEERQQIRWLVAVGSLAALALMAAMVTGTVSEARPTSQAWAAASTFAFLLLVSSVVIGIPVAVTIAVFKYHLYDLNLVIRKTVVFAMLAAFVTIVYVAIVVGLSQLVGGDSLLLSVAATALVAALFQPVRRRATRIANRLIFGSRAEPYEVLANFSERVGETYAAEDVLPRMARVIAEGIGAEGVELWLRRGGDLHLVASWPAERSPIDVPDRTIAVRHGGEVLGEVHVRKPASEPITPTEEKLLDDLASQAGLVLRNVGLTVDLQSRVDQLAQQADELRASRTRIVAAHDAERRRLERNIHDGAQQHLVALAVKLRLVKTVAVTDPAKGAEMLRSLASETATARATLLDLASGIYPAILEERGVGPALEEQARVGSVPIVVDTEGIGRLPIETEAAVYFVCLEAMQNAAKYAEADRIDVRLAAVNGDLRFEIWDDGVGFDPAAAEAGSGLRNMRDRLAAFAGEVTLETAPGRGTTVRGRIPMGRGVHA